MNEHFETWIVLRFCILFGNTRFFHGVALFLCKPDLDKTWTLSGRTVKYYSRCVVKRCSRQTLGSCVVVMWLELADLGKVCNLFKKGFSKSFFWVIPNINISIRRFSELSKKCRLPHKSEHTLDCVPSYGAATREEPVIWSFRNGIGFYARLLVKFYHIAFQKKLKNNIASFSEKAVFRELFLIASKTIL